MHSYANRQTDSRIGVRRCSTSPDIITGFEARRRLLSRYEYSRNERNDRERQENIRDYQRVRGTGRQRDPNKARRPRCNPPLFDIPRPRTRAERTHQARSTQRAEARVRHVSDSSESDRRTSRGNSTSDSSASHRERERNDGNSKKRSSGQDSVPQEQIASDAQETAPRKMLVAKRSIKSDVSDTSDTDHNEPSSSRKIKSPERSDSKEREIFMDSPPLVVGPRVEPATPEESVDNSSDDDSSPDQKYSKKKGKKTKKERKKSKKSKKKLHKAHKVVKKEKKKSKKTKSEASTSTGHSSGGEKSGASSSAETKVENGFAEGECQNVGSSQDIQQMRKKMAPMTKEQWEKQQSQIRREVSPTTGRVRLIKGTGEILEEIVSRDRHKAINRMATIGDGQAFQAGLQKKLKRN